MAETSSLQDEYRRGLLSQQQNRARNNSAPAQSYSPPAQDTSPRSQLAILQNRKRRGSTNDMARVATKTATKVFVKSIVIPVLMWLGGLLLSFLPFALLFILILSVAIAIST